MTTRPSRRPKPQPSTPPQDTCEPSPVPRSITSVHAVSHPGIPPSTREEARIYELGVAGSFAFRKNLHQTPRLHVPFPSEPEGGEPCGKPVNATISIGEDGEMILYVGDAVTNYPPFSLTNQRSTIRQFVNFLLTYLEVSEPT